LERDKISLISLIVVRTLLVLICFNLGKKSVADSR
jgi:hypothetical protein